MEDINIITDVVASINVILNQLQFREIILNGDLNVNLTGPQTAVLIIKSFMSNWTLQACTQSLSNNKGIIYFTYKHES